MKVLLLLAILGYAEWGNTQPLGAGSNAPAVIIAFPNGGFESGLDHWAFWSRDPKAGKATVETTLPLEGRQYASILHTGKTDWSLQPGGKIPVQPGDLLELCISVRKQGNGDVTLCASTWSATEENLSWSYADQSAEDQPGWQVLQTRVYVPPGVAWVQPRLIGAGEIRADFDNYSIRWVKDPALNRDADLPAQVSASNRWLTVTLNTANATFEIYDRRAKRLWKQDPTGSSVRLTGLSPIRQGWLARLVQGATGLPFTMSLQLDDHGPEVIAELSGQGSLPHPLRFPLPFQCEAGDQLVIPLNEGISYPVDDPSMPTQRLIAYGGHGICMAFWGVSSDRAGHMAIIETPDDAAIQVARRQGRLLVAPEWDAQKKVFGYARKLRYTFLEHGTHVAMAKRYRAYAQDKGLIVTLESKRQTNPNVDLLIGAVNVWCWDRGPVGIVKEMQAAGIDRILWSAAAKPEDLTALNQLGVLTSRYDIYQDVMNPAEFPKLQWRHPDWTTAAWPKDIILGSNGKWIKGWGVEAKDNSLIPCGVICDLRAPAYARERIPAELITHPYRCRFIDTTTAAPWNECYSSDHPMTRTESRESKMKLLRYVSEECKLVTGCETGHDASVPFLHYFEGMLSLGPYRVPDAGRRMEVIWTNVPPDVAKFQLGHQYRLPLWELVYHDCTVAQWYWGDYNNKLPALWDKRDLFNLLYGTPPMFMFTRTTWAENKARFVRSYLQTGPLVRRSGYSELVDHRFLNPDRSVQQTRFANGQEVTVNFGVHPFHFPNGEKLAAGGFKVTP